MISKKIGVLDAAISYAERGWRVLPVNTFSNGCCSCGKEDCGAKGKHPRIKDWQNKATTFEKTVATWWGKNWPETSIGIATGKGSNLFVLDVDGPVGAASLQDLVAKHGQLPDTLVAATGRGQHLYFRYPDCSVKNSAGSLGVGLDVRGDGGFVVAPPSQHASGIAYRWENPETQVQDAPEWLIGLLSGGQEAVQQEPEIPPTLDQGEGPIFEGTRNTMLFKKACALRGQGAEQDQIEEILMRINQEQCRPPLDAKEVKDIAATAAAYPAGARPEGTKHSSESPLWWFEFNVNDWFTDHHVQSMIDHQVGWYINLLAACWKRSGFLPKDLDKLARIARAEDRDRFRAESAEVLWEFEPHHDGVQIVNPRLNAEWHEAAVIVEQNRIAGKKSAEARKKLKEAA